MSLSQLLENIQKDTMDDDQAGWRQFILDHLDYIIRRSKVHLLDEELMNVYRYDLKRFLKNHMKINRDIGWIVLLVNGYSNDFEFVDITSMIIPTDELIANLFHLHTTIKNNTF